MKLIECYIENFGKISKQSFTFNDGFNCICENNGEGKTTLTVFIKVMLYGMSDTKKTAILENERKHYLPWGGGMCGGYLVVEAKGVRYRIERSFAPKAAADTCRIFNVDTGIECDEFTDGFGNEIFGIDAESFERTVFHSERNLTAKNDNHTISAKLSDLVGCDGDIGGMDEALEKLETKRKFYQKRGGGGKISEIRKEISDTEEKIADLSRLEYELSATEEKNEAIKARMAQITDRSATLAREQGRAILLDAQKENAQRISAIKDRLTLLARRRDDLSGFFGGSVPSSEDVEKASMYYTRANQMYESIQARTSPSEEYVILDEVFKEFNEKTSTDEIAEVKRARETVRRRDAEIEAQKASRFGKIFQKRVPTAEEINEIIELCEAQPKQKSPITAGVMLVAAAICAVVGIFISPVFFAMAVALVAVAAVIAVGTKKKQKDLSMRTNEEISGFIESVVGDRVEFNERLPLLYEMRALVKQAIIDDTLPERELLEEFKKKFSGASDVDTIIADYERYEHLKIKKSVIEDGLRSERSEADRLMLISRAFLSKYKVTGERPFDEIRDRVRNYNEICALMRESEAELSALGESGVKIDDSDSVRCGEDIEKELHAITEERASLERTYGANMRRIAECEQALLDKDALASKLAQLRESYDEAQNDLKIILLTQKYLNDAKVSITSRYLGKTKESFLTYVEAVSGITGESFEMDTTFEVTRLDSGASRSIDAYSRGTRELYNIAARMAVCDSLYTDELPFLIFDDPFVALDDDRIKRALELLLKISEKRQVIYLTCSRARVI